MLPKCGRAAYTGTESPNTSAIARASKASSSFDPLAPALT